MYAPIADQSSWKAKDLPAKKEALVINVSPPQIKILDAGLEAWKALGKSLNEIKPGDFDLGGMETELSNWFDILQNGRGALILRGLPVQRWSVDDSATVYLALGMQFGRPLTQSVMGDLVGHVIDMSKEKPDARSYQGNKELTFHSDFCDILGLMSLKRAVSGGLSRICSGVAIHDEMARTSPDLLRYLYDGFRVHRMGEESAGTAPVTPYRVPVFSSCEGKLSVLFVKVLCERAADLLGEPLSSPEVAALEKFAELANDPDYMLEFMLEPGEILFVNNLLMLHSRTSINNPPDAPRRHLLRLWVNVPDGRPRVRELDIYETAGGIGADDARKPVYADGGLDRAIHVG